jgi:hypothetical protein
MSLGKKHHEKGKFWFYKGGVVTPSCSGEGRFLKDLPDPCKF